MAARKQRKRLLQYGSHRYVAILEEAVLRQGIGDAEAMAGQLSYLTSGHEDFGEIAVARLRAAAGRYPRDHGLAALLAELRAGSEELTADPGSPSARKLRWLAAAS